MPKRRGSNDESQIRVDSSLEMGKDTESAHANINVFSNERLSNKPPVTVKMLAKSK